MGSSNNDDLQAGMVSAARDAALAGAERIHDARREFLKLFGMGAAAAAGMGAIPFAGAVGDAVAATGSPAGSPYAPAFGFAPGLLYMNIGTTGASPTQVVQHAAADYQDIASNPTAYFFGQQAMRNAIAPGFGCDPYELTLSFNTTDGLCRIIMGLQFQPGDEIITTNMEEDAGKSAAAMVRDRFGVVVREVGLPTNDAVSENTVMKRFRDQLNRRTRAILFSSPVYLTGARLPEKDLCRWAARNGVISIVDGAHGPGMLALDLHDMGCDFYSGAGHKWQCGPGQTGFMYIRNGFSAAPYVRNAPTSDLAPFGVPSPTVPINVPGYSNTTALPTYFPTNTLIYGATPILLNGSRNPDDNIAAILQLVGNGSRPSQKALAEACQLWDGWGRQAIEEYVVALAQYLRARIVDIWGPQALSVPYKRNPKLAARTGLTSFNPFSAGYDYNVDLSAAEAQAQATASSAAVATMRSAHQIVIRNNRVPHSLRSDPEANAAADALSAPLRVSTHLFHSTADDDRLIAALLQVVPHP